MARLLAHTWITPVQVTWASAVLLAAGAVLFGLGLYLVGALLTLAGAITDCADGDLARLTGRESRTGALLDSVLDRWTDSAAILALGFSDPDNLGIVASWALVVSLLTSYTRARAQSLGVDVPDGIGGRDSRLLLLVVGGVTGWVLLGLVGVAILGTATSIHRLVLAGKALTRMDNADRSGRGRRSGL
jgi:CDP-diacylglycerol--glycerol-3-phosphate 3-phosphatidyltransferase